jgi:hypothetical protein
MCSVPIDNPAAENARWLAEISEALEAAQDTLVGLEAQLEDRRLASELYQRIEAARFEVRSLRLSRSITGRRLHP